MRLSVLSVSFSAACGLALLSSGASRLSSGVLSSVRAARERGEAPGGPQGELSFEVASSHHSGPSVSFADQGVAAAAASEPGADAEAEDEFFETEQQSGTPRAPTTAGHPASGHVTQDQQHHHQSQQPDMHHQAQPLVDHQIQHPMHDELSTHSEWHRTPHAVQGTQHEVQHYAELRRQHKLNQVAAETRARQSKRDARRAAFRKWTRRPIGGRLTPAYLSAEQQHRALQAEAYRFKTEAVHSRLNKRQARQAKRDAQRMIQRASKQSPPPRPWRKSSSQTHSQQVEPQQQEQEQEAQQEQEEQVQQEQYPPIQFGAAWPPASLRHSQQQPLGQQVPHPAAGAHVTLTPLPLRHVSLDHPAAGSVQSLQGHHTEPHQGLLQETDSERAFFAARDAQSINFYHGRRQRMQQAQHHPDQAELAAQAEAQQIL